ncbi:magnesium transporter [Thioalkalivibrio sulfidiphilus]|uniref:magnesium transporter n=1 Tax=Thioalkalivibrio sulfidiphilus TaxID=1033854 RepID=UPI000378E0CF|nr:magnesium transporter [Thioalkalivibrio sulfidiphilus]
MEQIIFTLLRQGELDKALAIIKHTVPAETARRLAELEPEDRWTLFRRLGAADARAVFLHLDDEEQAGLMESMGLDEAARFAAHLPLYTLARTHALLPRPFARDLLERLPAEKYQGVRAMLGHHEDTVARVMRGEFLAVQGDIRVEEALQALRDNPLLTDDTGSVLFVIDSGGRYQGYVRLSTLLRAPADERVHRIMQPANGRVTTDDDKVEAARLLQRTNLPVLPVVDAQGVMVGILRFDDAMDVLEEDTSEDVYKKAGVGDLIHATEVVRSEKLTAGGIGYPVKVRLLFLMVTLAGGLMVGGLIDHFEETLAAVIALAVFIPLVMDMGGNVGTQSTTIFARGLALGHIHLGQFFRKHLLRELKVGLSMGILIGLLAGTVAWLWQGAPNGIPELGVVVGVALFFAVTTASVLGFLLPWVMLKLGVDHAPGADPFITTIKDFTGLAVYFLMAGWLIGVA